MKGRGLSKTIYGGVDFVDILNFDIDKEIRLGEAYGFSKSKDGKIIGKGVLVCYSGDLNDILELYPGLEPINMSITDGVINRMILSNGVAGLNTTNIIRYENVKNSNWVNAFNNGLDLIMIRKDFDKLADKDLFWNTVLPKEAYKSLKLLFHGGVMNAKSGIYSNVKSADLVSAHASNIVSMNFPLGKYEKCFMSIDRVKKVREVKEIFYTGIAHFTNIRLKEGYIGIVYSKNNAVIESHNRTENKSGYVISADKLVLPITETYMECIDMCYEYDDVKAVGDIYVCTEVGKLPENVREYVYSKFEDKQQKPKGSIAYDEAKLLVNYCYGFLCRGTEDYSHYIKGHKLAYPFQWGVAVCLYTTLKIVKSMVEVVQKGGKVIAIATDSIKWQGDVDLEYGDKLGELKYEGIYDKAYIETVYRAIYKKGDELEVKLAGCLKDKAKDYFSAHHPLDISKPYVKISEGKVNYLYNPKTSRVESVFSDYTMGVSYI